VENSLLRLTRSFALAGSLLSLALSGCALLDQGSPNFCPSTAILDGPGELVRFTPGPENGPGDVSFRSKMKAISGICEIDEKSITMELNVAMETLRGPANAKGEAQFVYFVAILDKEKNVLTRTKFPMIAKFQRQETKLEFSEAVTVTIPKKKEAMPQDYMVYLGYEMTPEELAYNRERLRSR
jgi:hypothetical protein